MRVHAVYLNGLHYNKRQVRETLKCRNKIGSMLVRRKSSPKLSDNIVSCTDSRLFILRPCSQWVTVFQPCSELHPRILNSSKRHWHEWSMITEHAHLAIHVMYWEKSRKFLFLATSLLLTVTFSSQSIPAQCDGIDNLFWDVSIHVSFGSIAIIVATVWEVYLYQW